MPDIDEPLPNGTVITRQGRGVYLVASERRSAHSYMVDIEANNLLGSCTCDDFSFRRFPEFYRTKERRDRYRCKHLRAVRSHVLDQILAHYQKTVDPKKSSGHNRNTRTEQTRYETHQNSHRRTS